MRNESPRGSFGDFPGSTKLSCSDSWAGLDECPDRPVLGKAFTLSSLSSHSAQVASYLSGRGHLKEESNCLSFVCRVPLLVQVPVLTGFALGATFYTP